MSELMQTINELKGDLNNLGLGFNRRHKSIVLMPKSSPYGLCGTISTKNTVVKPFKFICTIEEFNDLVAELSATELAEAE